MVLVVGGTRERLAAVLHRAAVRPLTGVRANVHLANVGRAKAPPAALERADKRPLTCSSIENDC